MSTNLALHTCPNEEDYIDMELITTTSSKNIEFEFQMSFSCNDQKTQDNNNNNMTSSSPADELFYKGKLLPLHLPPRQQMVENLLELEITNMPSEEEDHHINHLYHSSPMPLIIGYNSCNISPSESCRVSCDQDYNNHFLNFSGDLSRFVDNRPIKKPWPKRLKLIKHSSILGQKLKDSSAYLKSLFTKSAVCSEGSNCKRNLSKDEALLSKYLKVNKGSSFEHIISTTTPCSKIATFIDHQDNSNVSSRRSFSGAIKRHCSPAKCLSSSSSSSSSSDSSSSSSSSSSPFKTNGQCELNNLLRRSSSVSEIEASIDAAIAHCKKSMQIFHEEKAKS